MGKINPSELPLVLRNSANLELFVMVRYAVDMAALSGSLNEHLEWMLAEEKEGSIFLSGPIEPGEGDSPVGLTILRAGDIEGARRIAQEDPFYKAGCIRFDLYKWTVFEGAFPVTFRLSDSSVRFT